MVRFLVEFVVASIVLLLATIPITIVARQRGRHRTPLRWRIGAVVCGFCVAVLGWSSRDLVQKCVDARDDACFDVGSAGMKLLFVGCFVGWALISAYLLHND